MCHMAQSESTARIIMKMELIKNWIPKEFISNLFVFMKKYVRSTWPMTKTEYVNQLQMLSFFLRLSMRLSVAKLCYPNVSLNKLAAST